MAKEDFFEPSVDLSKPTLELEALRTEFESKKEELKRTRTELLVLQEQFDDLYESSPCGYLNLNAKGSITWANRAGTVMLDSDRKGILQVGFSQFLSPSCQGSYFSALRRARDTREKQSLELKLEGAQDSVKWIWTEIRADCEQDGGIAGFRLTIVDITLKKQNADPIAESEKKYEQLLREITCGVILLEITEFNPDGRIVDSRIIEVNRAFERLTRIPLGEAVGNTLRSLWPYSGTSWISVVDLVVRYNQHVEADVLHQELGKSFLVSAFPQYNNRIGVMFVDISDRKSREQQLEEANRDLEIVIKERADELRSIRMEIHKGLKTLENSQVTILDKANEPGNPTYLSQIEEMTAALNVLLKERENQRSKLEEEVTCNINELIRPQLAALAKGTTSERQRFLLDVVIRSLDDLTSPLSRRLIIESSRLSPMESKVANMIRQGRSTKEIADNIGVATSTVDYHRLNIRHKLGLTNKKTNLQSYLKSLL